MERREFIRMSAAGTAGAAAGKYFRPFTTEKKLRVGLIGAGWYGMVVTRAAFAAGGVEIIGVCDVDSEHLDGSIAEIEKLQGTRPVGFRHYNDLLGMKDLEAVFIATPPHWHALQFIAACRKGLHIYCEKPLAYDIREGLAMVDAASGAGNIVQIGFQRRQSEAFRKTGELLANGRIGAVHQIMAQINYVPEIKDTTVQKPPASLDWDEWCGPAPMLPYRPSIGHVAWRLEKEFGNGHLVDWGIHHIDIIRHITGEGMPSAIYTSGGLFNLKGKITTPDTLTSQMNFPGVPLMWQHRLWGMGDASRDYNNGIFFYGEKGTVFAQDSQVVIIENGSSGKREELTFRADNMQEDHMRNFLEAVRSGNNNSIHCPPSDAFKSTATVQLAMISYYTGSMISWDEKKMEIRDNPAASKLLKREYRDKYTHP